MEIIENHLYNSFSVPVLRQYLRNRIDLVYVIKTDFRCISHLSHIYLVIVVSQTIQIKSGKNGGRKRNLACISKVEYI